MSDERLWSLRRDGFSVVYADIGECLEVAGGPTWTAESHRYLGPKVLELVADYNAEADPDERLQGIQFDIEPYVDLSFWDDVRPPSRRTS